MPKAQASVLIGCIVAITNSSAQATTVPVTSIEATLSEHELLSFVAGGVRYGQAQLIQPTLTAFESGSGDNILVGIGESLPSAGNRSLLLTGDFYLDTGILNPGNTADAATLTFSPALVNGPGPDLVMFEADSAIPDKFQVNTNSRTRTYDESRYGPPVIGAIFDLWYRNDGGPANMSDLEYSPYSWQGYHRGGGLYGIAIDLDDFGVPPLQAVSTVNFGSIDSVDPVLFMGINSALQRSADFDSDGDVDGDDFLIWQAGFATDGRGDADGDADTDGDDFLLWQAEFGSGAGEGSAVPEPTAQRILLLLLLACGTRSHRTLGNAIRQRHALGTDPPSPHVEHTAKLSRNTQLISWFSCAILCCTGGLQSVSRTAASEFIPLGDLPGGAFKSLAYAVSDDGTTVVGQTEGATTDAAFMWTEPQGMSALWQGNGNQGGIAFDVSSDGTVVVGRGADADRERIAVVWTRTGVESLGSAAGEAYAVSADGSVVVGETDWRWSYPRDREAYRWTSDAGVTVLSDSPQYDGIFWASGVSADGSIVVGVDLEHLNGAVGEAIVWNDQQPRLLGHLANHTISEATAISADGNVVVGHSGGRGLTTQAFHWTEQHGMIALNQGNGAIPNFARSVALGVSGNGNIVVGQAFGNAPLAFIWNAGRGMNFLQTVLADEYGLAESLDGWVLRHARDVSENGLFIVGDGTNPNGQTEAWLVRLDQAYGTNPPPGALGGDFDIDGDVDGDDFLIWQANFGLADPFGRPVHEYGDADGDGDIDGDDFLLWQAEYGNRGGAGVAIPVPEPTGASLILLAAVSGLFRVR